MQICQCLIRNMNHTNRMEINMSLLRSSKIRRIHSLQTFRNYGAHLRCSGSLWLENSFLFVEKRSMSLICATKCLPRKDWRGRYVYSKRGH
jgi:hypothetical protein